MLNTQTTIKQPKWEGTVGLGNLKNFLAQIQAKQGNDFKPPLILAFSMVEYHSPDKMEAILFAIDKQVDKFSKIVIVAGSTLQRWNYLSQGKSKSQAYKESLKKAAEYGWPQDKNTQQELNNYLLFKNGIEDKTIPVTCYTWDELLAGKEVFITPDELDNPDYRFPYSGDFDNSLNMIKKLRGEKAEYNTMLEATTIEAARILCSPTQISDWKRAKDNTREYIEEESAVFKLLGEQYPHAIFYYPLTCSPVARKLVEAYTFLPEGTINLHFGNLQMQPPASQANKSKKRKTPPRTEQQATAPIAIVIPTSSPRNKSPRNNTNSAEDNSSDTADTPPSSSPPDNATNNRYSMFHHPLNLEDLTPFLSTVMHGMPSTFMSDPCAPDFLINMAIKLAGVCTSDRHPSPPKKADSGQLLIKSPAN